MQITSCILSNDLNETLYKNLLELDISTTENNTVQKICELIDSLVCDAENRLMSVDKESYIHAHIKTVSKHERYLLYEGSDDTFPRFLFLLSFFNGTNKQKRRSKKNKRLQVFAFSGCVGVSSGGGAVLLQSLSQAHTQNLSIVAHMKPFMWKTCAPRRNQPSSVRDSIHLTSSHGFVSTVRVYDRTGKVSLLDVYDAGLGAVDELVATVGALNEFQNAGRVPSSHRMTIQQNAQFSLVVFLLHGTFRLVLYETSAIFRNGGVSQSKLTPLITLYHSFDFMGGIVEQTHDNAILEDEMNRIDLSKECKTASKENQFSCKITGMRMVVHTILKRKIPAFSIRVIAVNPSACIYEGMTNIDINQVICAMGLISDQKAKVKILKRLHYNSDVVKLVSNDSLIPHQHLIRANSAQSKNCPEECPSFDFRLYACDALNHAIAHQNNHIMKRLMNAPGLNIQEICRVLLSGISFCYSPSYHLRPEHTYDGVGVHIINQSDFSESCTPTVDALLNSYIAGLKPLDTVLWGEISHNFCVQTAVNDKIFKQNVGCHTTELGIVFFRLLDHTFTRDRFSLISVYIPPEIIKVLPSMVNDRLKFLSKASPIPVSVPVHPVPVLQHKEHELVNIVKKLTTERIQFKRDLLRNATNILFHLNAICVHNEKFFALGGNSQEHHELLRSMWFDTYTKKAVSLCQGVQNAQFCEIYLHLKNLALLPTNSVGFWANVPYV